MTLTTSLFKPLIVAFLAALAIAAGTASAAQPPGLSPGSGCATQCIKKALVTTTATAAKVELETTVAAHLIVSVTKQTASNGSGGLASNGTKTVSVSAFSPNRTAFFLGLEPDTTYAIVVKATDLQGRKASQAGTFKTLPVKTTGQSGAGSLDSGVGCAVQCIEQALFTQAPPAASVANADIRTATDARIQLVVSHAGNAVSAQASPGLVRSWKTQIGGLLYGTTYDVLVRATDAQGRTSIRKGTFKTVSAVARVTIHKLKILNDGDKGRNKGELYFRYYADGHEVASNGRFEKIRSVSVIGARTQGTSRPGVSITVSANGDAKLGIKVVADECDAVLKKNCVVEAGGGNADAYAGGQFDLSELLANGALPSWQGTGVNAPAGHDGYFVFETSPSYVKFLVLATVDLYIDWP